MASSHVKGNAPSALFHLIQLRLLQIIELASSRGDLVMLEAFNTPLFNAKIYLYKITLGLV